MKSSIIKGIIIILATIIGYSLMGFLITIVQEWIFHGVSYNKSSLLVLAIAGIGTFLSAVIGGWVAFKINSKNTKISNVLMSILVVIETTWLLKTYKADSPVWFDVLAALSLIIGILLGCSFDYLKNLKFLKQNA
jgi:hypothetical protein